MREELEAVWAGFTDPPDEARPRAWWHWMDGNVDPEGIRLDLEWLHGVGVRGVQMFDDSMGTPLVVPEKIRFGSAQWQAALNTAKATARRLGLEFAIATSPGWSAAGGPWVSPADAVKKVVWSETLVTGGGPVEVALAPLPDTAGPYQDLPRWALAGYMVADAGSSDRFLFDYRRTLSDLLISEYYATVAGIAHSHGLARARGP